MQQRVQILLAIAVLLGITTSVMFRDAVFPGGLGISRSQSIVVKTERQLPDGATKETTITTQPGKSLWDWLSLLGVPLSLLLIGAWVQSSQQQKAGDGAKEEALQAYFERISALLLEKDIFTLSSPDLAHSSEAKRLLSTAADIIRASTLSILRRFESDAKRKTSVIRFLLEADVVQRLSIRLEGADLSGVDLSHVDLLGINLENVNFRGANLTNTSFKNADLKGVNFQGAKIQSANFDGAELLGVDFTSVRLGRNSAPCISFKSADLVNAVFSGLHLVAVDFSEANLMGADLRNTKLGIAKFNHATLNAAQLDNADLTRSEFREAEMLNVGLSGANLTGADLAGALLAYTEPEKALINAEAKLKKTNLNNVKFNTKTCWPSKEELSKARNVSESLLKQKPHLRS